MKLKGKMKKIYKILINISIIAGFLILFFLAFSYFIGFKELIKTTRLSSEISSFLSGLNLFIFVIFGLLFLLKFLFPKIFNRYVADSINNPIYIIVSCIILTLIMPRVIFEHSLTWFTWKYFVIIFTYLFGIVTIYVLGYFSVNNKIG